MEATVEYSQAFVEYGIFSDWGTLVLQTCTAVSSGLRFFPVLMAFFLPLIWNRPF